MPRVSQAIAKQTRQKIIDTAFEILVNKGLDQLTFTNIANSANISRSGINAHFRKKEDMLIAMRPMVKEKFRSMFNFNSPQEFYNSWIVDFDTDEEFRRLVIGGCAFISDEDGIIELKKLINGNPIEIDMYIKMAIGHAVVSSTR